MPPELKTEPLVVISCVESVKTPPAIVPVNPLFFRAIGQLCLFQDKQLFCNNVPASSLQLTSIINAAVTTSASCKVEAASESGRSDLKLPSMESDHCDRRRPLSHVRDRSVDSDQKTLFMFGNGGERSEAVDAKCSNSFGCRVTMTMGSNSENTEIICA